VSSGHRHHEGFGINSQVLDRYLKNDNVRTALYQSHKINKEFDVPYLGGYSKKGDTIYFDRHLPDQITLECDGAKKVIDPIPFLTMHETLEKALIDQLGFNYQHSHKVATAYEKRGLLQALGPGWWNPYQKVMNRYIKADAHEKLKRVPHDLDLRPMMDEHDTKLLEHMKKCMKRKK